MVSEPMALDLDFKMQVVTNNPMVGFMMKILKISKSYCGIYEQTELQSDQGCVEQNEHGRILRAAQAMKGVAEGRIGHMEQSPYNTGAERPPGMKNRPTGHENLQRCLPGGMAVRALITDYSEVTGSGLVLFFGSYVGNLKFLITFGPSKGIQVPPHEVGIIVQFEGVAKGNLGRAGAGEWVFQRKEIQLTFFAQGYKWEVKNFVELEALSTGLSLAKDGGSQSLRFQGNSGWVINLLKGKGEKLLWALVNNVHRVRSLVKLFSSSHARQIRKSSNKIMTLMADLGASLSTHTLISLTIPAAAMEDRRYTNHVVMRWIEGKIGEGITKDWVGASWLCRW
eukprot:Gb_35440 [translate_table: standard]